MAQQFQETAHLKTNKSAFDEGWERIFGKKEDSPEPKTTAYAVRDGEVVEISEEERLRNTRHITAGMCGESGFNSFDEKAFKENFDKIDWGIKESEDVPQLSDSLS
jgi:hypothetical protein